MALKILCTADVHIGRRPSRLPQRVDVAALSCARAWEAIVRRALEERVDLLLVAGDLVDQANRFYEAAGPVEAGVRALENAGIPLVAVAGNHDHDSLPWLAERFPAEQFTLLGAGGRWERHTVVRDGRPVLHLDGWSFPGPAVLDDPLREYPVRERDGVPVLGMVHGDLDQPASRHGPLSTASLRARAVDFWLLGHVHRAAHHTDAGVADLLYPGSPQAMDPGEPGMHGPWLLDIDDGGRFAVRQVPLSTVRYEVRDVSVEGVEDEGEVRRRVADAVRDAAADVQPDAGGLRYLSLRLRLVGRTAMDRWLREFDWAETEDLESALGEITALVERVEVATRPVLDLEAIATGRDAPALLARLVRGLDSGELDPRQEGVLRDAVARATEVSRMSRYLPVRDEGADSGDGRMREVLRGQALLLLEGLLAEREGV